MSSGRAVSAAINAETKKTRNGRGRCARKSDRVPESHLGVGSKVRRRRSGVRAKALRGWLEQIGVETLYMDPGGSPWETGYGESFHSRVRDELLVTEEFESLSAARSLTCCWGEYYNQSVRTVRWQMWPRQCLRRGGLQAIRSQRR